LGGLRWGWGGCDSFLRKNEGWRFIFGGNWA
jgi:hypothetical protein